MSKVSVFVTLMCAILFTDLANASLQCSNSPQREIYATPLDILFEDFSRDMSPEEFYLSKIYVKLTGITLPRTHPRFRRALRFFKNDQIIDAGKIITGEENFLKIRMKNFSAPLSNADYTPTEPLNDMQALIIGITRDEIDARQILTGDLRYSGYEYLGLSDVSRENNDHYESFERSDLSFTRDLEKVDDQWSDLDIGSGVFTTRAWAKAHYPRANTNRRSLQYAFEVFLCAPIDSWKFRGIPDHFVRRDIPRDPGGDPSTYQNRCRNCHAPMDAMGGAFSKFDFFEGQFLYMKDGVAEQMNRGGDIYPAGYVTLDDSWNNLLSYNPTVDFGWRTELQGRGVGSFANMIANSSGFSRCMASRVYRELCGEDLWKTAPAAGQQLVTKFEESNYNLKELFINTVFLNECVERPMEER